MRISLAGHFSYPRLIRFVLPPILMMICTSIYGVVDGFFVSNYIGKLPFAAVNLVMPVNLLAVAIGYMIGEGGNALISKTLGEGNTKLANEYFSLLVLVSAIMGAVLSLLGVSLIPRIAASLGATSELLPLGVTYGRILFAAQIFYVLQNVFQSFFIAAGKPVMSLKVSILAGITNALLDYLFIVVFQWGLEGAALATALGQIVGTMVPIIYFIRKNSSMLRLVRPVWYGWAVWHTFTNGCSEMASVMSGAMINAIYNLQLISIAGEDGLAAYGAIMYVNFVFTSIFLGYASASAPLISFQYGAKNHKELRNLVKKSIILMFTSGFLITIISQLAAAPMLWLFVGYDEELFQMTVEGFRLFALAFLLMGFNIFGSGLFTALNNGPISAAVSLIRIFGFELICLMVLPIYFGLTGIWSSIFVAEILATIVTAGFIIAKQKQYNY